MGYRWLGLVIVAASCILAVLRSEPASAAGAAAFAAQADLSARGGAEQAAFHHHRTYTYYCYPKNYWWFYRPYTTAVEGYARCMPYFHYLEPYGGRKSQRYIK
jgi:hypothetical protein